MSLAAVPARASSSWRTRSTLSTRPRRSPDSVFGKSPAIVREDDRRGLRPVKPSARHPEVELSPSLRAHPVLSSARGILDEVPNFSPAPPSSPAVIEAPRHALRWRAEARSGCGSELGSVDQLGNGGLVLVGLHELAKRVPSPRANLRTARSDQDSRTWGHLTRALHAWRNPKYA